jgi:hypothetical protein
VSKEQLSETLQARIYDNVGNLQLTIQDLRELVIVYMDGDANQFDEKKFEELAMRIVERWASEAGKRELMLLADSLKTLYNSKQDGHWLERTERNR